MSQGWFDEMWMQGMYRDAKTDTYSKKQAEVTHIIPMGSGLATNAFFVRGICYQVSVQESQLFNGLLATLTADGGFVDDMVLKMGMDEAKAMPNTLLGLLRGWLNEKTDW